MSVLLKSNMQIGHKIVEYQNWPTDRAEKGVDIGRRNIPCSRLFLKKFTQYIKLFSLIHAATNPVIANDRKEMSVRQHL
jgi:hypothetical protein